MFHFDLTQEPLTNRELEAERQSIKEMRRTQIKYSCISDVLHAFVFIGLYFNHFLSGYAILLAVALSTVIALVLSTTCRDNLKVTDQIAIGILSLATASTTMIILVMAMQQALTGSIIAGLTTGSIVIVGATLGRKIKKVLATIEAMKPIIDDNIAHQEVMTLCRKFPELETYRESAARYLRPHLTYGELEEMRKWMEGKQQNKAEAV